MRQIHGDEVTTLYDCGSEVNGLLLDEGNGLLYASIDHCVVAIRIGTLAERREARYYPALRTWALMQGSEERARIIPLDAEVSAREACAHFALDMLMRCSIPDILVRTLTFLYN